MSHDALLLAIDIGTTACKVVLFDTGGTVLSQANHEYPIMYPRPLWAEQDPEDWWRAAVQATQECMGQAGPDARRRIAAIGLSSQRETMAAVDQEGRPLGNAILWMDRRSTEQAEAVGKLFGEKAIHRRTGMLPDATFSLTKLMWLSQKQPELVQKARLFLQPKEFVGYRMTQVAATEPSLASRTMMFDLQEETWIDELVEAAGIKKEQLPPIIPSGAVLGRLTREAAQAMHLVEGIPVVAGGGDRPLEALGSGIGRHGVMESTGTTSNVSAPLSALPDPIEGGTLCSRHVVPGYFLLEQGMSATGAILRWFRDQFGHEEKRLAQETGADPYDVISEAAAMRPPGAGGLIALPFFMGARATRWNPRARGVLFGLTLEHTRADVARSLMEGVAYEIAACLEVLRRAGHTPQAIRVLGGGAKAGLWNQIKADITGLGIEVPRVTEAAALGAAILAGTAVGLFSDPMETAARLNPVVCRFEPDPERQPVYQELRQRYESLYAALRPLFDEVREL
jgi:Sugar (pentulose and hexulose) kinases